MKSTAKMTYNESAKPIRGWNGFESPAMAWECSDNEGNSGRATTPEGAYSAYKAAKAESDALNSI